MRMKVSVNFEMEIEKEKIVGVANLNMLICYIIFYVESIKYIYIYIIYIFYI